MDVIWETDELKVDIVPPKTVRARAELGGDYILIHPDELTAFARHWLDLQGYDVTKREDENGCLKSKIDVHLTALSRLGYEVTLTERKPEIKACPVCEKFNVDGKRTTESKVGNIVHHVVCNNCGITISKLSRNEAIEAWNALPRKGE